MDSSPSPSPSARPLAATETISATLRMILRALMAALGACRVEPLVAIAFYRRANATIRQIERMLVRFRTGRLWQMPHRLVVQGRKVSRTPDVRLPRKFGWLVQAARHHAAYVGPQLQTVLNTPEMVELLAASPQAQRILRPLCRALAVELPWTVDKPRAESARKPRKPRPKPEPFKIPLPRGMLTWARREKELENAIKLRNELVLKMAKTRLR